MELRAIATLQGGPGFQRTSVHVWLKTEELPGKVRYDLAVMGDIREADWQPGDLETGPNYHTSAELAGAIPSTERAARLLKTIGEEIRSTLELRLRRIAKSQPEGKSDLYIQIAGVVDHAASYDNAPPQGKLDEPFIVQIGTEIRAFLQGELQRALVSVPSPTSDAPQKIKLADQQALDLYKAGRLPLRPDQLERLCGRLGVPVP